jgi:hypothetical protein
MLVTSTVDYENVLLNLLFCSQYHSPYFKISREVLAFTVMVDEQSTSNSLSET